MLAAPAWLQTVLAAEALALAWLAWRFGGRGIVWGVAAAAASWLLFGLAASFLVSRLEGGGAPLWPDIVRGAGEGAVRLAVAVLPLLLMAALGGLLLRRVVRRKGPAE